MPVRPGQDAQGNFMRWGAHGAKYYYHGRVAKQAAIAAATRQGRAVHATGWREPRARR